MNHNFKNPGVLSVSDLNCMAKMHPLGVGNTKAIISLQENYEKESRQRINYSNEDITRTVIEAGMLTTTRDHITAAQHRITAPTPDYLLGKDGATKFTEDAKKPVAREIKDSLLESRLEYLKMRSSLRPDDKYSFVEGTNWMYGWRFAESGVRMAGPAHGLVHYMFRNRRGRVGVRRDPDHYKAPYTDHTLYKTI